MGKLRTEIIRSGKPTATFQEQNEAFDRFNSRIDRIKNKLPTKLARNEAHKKQCSVSEQLQDIKLLGQKIGKKKYAVRFIVPTYLATSYVFEQPNDFLLIGREFVSPRLTRVNLRNTGLIVCDWETKKILDVKIHNLFHKTPIKTLESFLRELMYQHVEVEFIGMGKRSNGYKSICKYWKGGVDLVEAFIRYQVDLLLLKGIRRGYYYSIHLGLYPQYSKYPHPTSETKSIKAHWISFLKRTDQYWKVLEIILEKLFPDAHKHCMKIREYLTPEMRELCIGPFTTMAINFGSVDFSAETLPHRDKDSKFVVCCVIPLGDFYGGDLDLIEHGVSAAFETGDVMMFDSSSLHQNRAVLAGIRRSLTLYVGRDLDAKIRAFEQGLKKN